MAGRTSIQQLSPSVINKIAAGEVIERPASVVKELVENSIDAGATSIDISIQQGGAELIRIVDNGHGIPSDELLLAVASHATSKIRDADDLFNVRTMGFRGEALASIAEISEFHLRSRVAESDAGAEIEIRGGVPGPIEPCGCAVGTAIEVRRLFFNTPVRRKFMRTAQTEMGHATEAVTRIALAHPHVRFALHSGQRTTLELNPVTDIRERIAHCFGAELAEDLIWVESEDGTARISGYVANPKHSRSTNKQQYVFLNSRFIKDRTLQHALSEAYRGILLTGRFPIAFLQLEIPADTVDVNVHPTKLEVRFQDSGRLYSQLLGMLRSRFLTTDLTATFQPVPPTETGENVNKQSSFRGGPSPNDHPPSGRREDGNTAVPTPHFARDRSEVAPFRPFDTQEFGPPKLGAHELGSGKYGTDHVRDDVVRWARGEGDGRTDSATIARNTFASPLEPTEQGTLAWHEEPKVGASYSPRLPVPGELRDSRTFHAETNQENQTVTPAGRAMQVHNRYLITASDDGIVIIDQHALHERILYEQLREKILSEKMEKQRLLVPEPVSLSPVEASSILQARDLLSDLGIDVEDIGGDTVLVSSYPAMLANFSPGELIRQLAEQLTSETKTPDARDLLDDLLHMISCKAAIKAGDRLAPEEIEALIEQRHLVQDSHHCPHGRPTTLIFTQKELDHRFQRI